MDIRLVVGVVMNMYIFPRVTSLLVRHRFRLNTLCQRISFSLAYCLDVEGSTTYVEKGTQLFRRWMPPIGLGSTRLTRGRRREDVAAGDVSASSPSSSFSSSPFFPIRF